MKDSVNEKKGFFLEINLSIALFYSKLASFRKPHYKENIFLLVSY
jgi:hypothetical protein